MERQDAFGVGHATQAVSPSESRAVDLNLDLKDKRELVELAKSDYQCVNRPRARSLDVTMDLEKRADPYDLLKNGVALCVEGTSQQYMRFTDNRFGIGTIGLCGCTGVVIASKVGAIVAHIAPTLASVDDQLREIVTLFKDNAEDLKDALVYIFSSAVNGVTDVPVFANYIKGHLLTHLGRTIRLRTYERTKLSAANAHNGAMLVTLVAGTLKIWLDGITFV